MCGGVKFAEEIVEVDASLFGGGQGIVERAQHPSLASSRRTPEVNVFSGGGPVPGTEVECRIGAEQLHCFHLPHVKVKPFAR